MEKLNLSYGCFSEQGATNLPGQEEINDKITANLEPIIFMDSCVCLHIIKVIDYGKKATGVDLSRIIALKEYLAQTPKIKISPFFGFMELCLNGDVFNKEKFRDFKYRMDFFEQIPLKTFKQFRYDFGRDMMIFRDPSISLKDQYVHITDLLKKSYCALLKMRSMALKDLSKGKAENNINAFLDWMIDELDSVRAAEYKLALNVFGGNTIYRKMIGLDSKSSEVKKKLMGTCWDIFHAKNSANSFQLSKILGRPIYPFFLTSDANLYNIFRGFALSVIKDGGTKFTSSFILGSDVNHPHISQAFIEQQNEKMLDIFINRRHHISRPNDSNLDTMITELEIANGLSPQKL